MVRSINAVDLEDRLGDVEADCRDRFRSLNLADGRDLGTGPDDRLASFENRGTGLELRAHVGRGRPGRNADANDDDA